jgi:hypothetical protein
MINYMDGFDGLALRWRVYCAVRTEFLTTIQVNFHLSGAHNVTSKE